MTLKPTVKEFDRRVRRWAKAGTGIAPIVREREDNYYRPAPSGAYGTLLPLTRIPRGQPTTMDDGKSLSEIEATYSLRLFRVGDDAGAELHLWSRSNAGLLLAEQYGLSVVSVRQAMPDQLGGELWGNIPNDSGPFEPMSCLVELVIGYVQEWSPGSPTATFSARDAVTISGEESSTARGSGGGSYRVKIEV